MHIALYYVKALQVRIWREERGKKEGQKEKKNGYHSNQDANLSDWYRESPDRGPDQPTTSACSTIVGWSGLDSDALGSVSAGRNLAGPSSIMPPFRQAYR